MTHTKIHLISPNYPHPSTTLHFRIMVWNTIQHLYYQEKDPFWDDPSTEQHIGSVHVYLQSLAYQVDVDENLQITDYRGIEQGQLKIEMMPCTKNGKDIGDDYVDEPSELVGWQGKWALCQIFTGYIYIWVLGMKRVLGYTGRLQTRHR